MNGNEAQSHLGLRFLILSVRSRTVEPREPPGVGGHCRSGFVPSVNQRQSHEIPRYRPQVQHSFGHDLRRLPCIVDTNFSGQANWRFVDDGKPVTVHVAGAVKVNSPVASMQAALAGLGFATVPTYLAGPSIAAGRLVVVLEAFAPEGPSLMAVYPHRRHLAGKVRALIDYLVGWFVQNPVR